MYILREGVDRLTDVKYMNSLSKNIGGRGNIIFAWIENQIFPSWSNLVFHTVGVLPTVSSQGINGHLKIIRNA